MVPVTDLLAHLLQGHTLPDQFLSHFQSALGHKIVKGGGGPFLKQLGHGGHTDTAVGGNVLQGQLFRQMGVHISGDLFQKNPLFLAGTRAFLTAL